MTATVVIPTKNRLCQTMKAIASAEEISAVREIIVVDDGSSFSVCEYNARTSKRNNIVTKVLVNAGPKGAQGARVTGVKCATNDLIIFLDSDDVLNKAGIISIIQGMKQDVSIALGYGNTCYGNRISDWLRLSGDHYETILRNLSLCPFSGIVARKSLIRWDKLRLDLPSWQDDDFCLVAAKFGRVRFFNHIAAHNFPSEDSISNSALKKLQGLDMLLRKYEAEIILSFGIGRIYIWKIRRFALWLEVCGNSLELNDNGKFLDGSFIKPLLAKLIYKLSVFIKYLIRPFFDKIYV